MNCWMKSVGITMWYARDSKIIYVENSTGLANCFDLGVKNTHTHTCRKAK